MTRLIQSDALDLLEKCLRDYNYKIHLKTDTCICFYQGQDKGSFRLEAVEDHAVLALEYESKFKQILSGEAERQRFIAASDFSKLLAPMMLFSYSPPNKYNYQCRLTGIQLDNQEELSLAAEYLLCTCIEGFNFLDSKDLYKSPRHYNVLYRTLQNNIKSALPFTITGQNI